MNMLTQHLHYKEKIEKHTNESLQPEAAFKDLIYKYSENRKKWIKKFKTVKYFDKWFAKQVFKS